MRTQTREMAENNLAQEQVMGEVRNQIAIIRCITSSRFGNAFEAFREPVHMLIALLTLSILAHPGVEATELVVMKHGQLVDHKPFRRCSRFAKRRRRIYMHGCCIDAITTTCINQFHAAQRSCPRLEAAVAASEQSCNGIAHAI